MSPPSTQPSLVHRYSKRIASHALQGLQKCLASLGTGALCPELPDPTYGCLPHSANRKGPIAIPESSARNSLEGPPDGGPEPPTIVRVFPGVRARFGAARAGRGQNSFSESPRAELVL